MINHSIEVRITIDGDDFSVFQGLFAYGFRVSVEAGATLFDILCRQIGISETYINDRVQTVFLNGKAVDDPVHEIVTDNAVIALSAAMPGLAGAVFRKGGMLSSMRSSHGVRSPEVSVTKQQSVVTLKLFNLIASDLGADFLNKGIFVKRDHFVQYFNWKESQLKSVCLKLTIDGKNHEMDDLFSIRESEGDIFLHVDSV